MKKIITTLLLVLGLVGYVGLTGSLAAASGEMVNDNYNLQLPGTVNLFGVDEAENNAGALPDRDVGMARGFDFGAGDAWSPYPPYHRNDK